MSLVSLHSAIALLFRHLPQAPQTHLLFLLIPNPSERKIIMTRFPTIGFIIIHKKLNVDDVCFSQSLFLPSSPIKYRSHCILCVQLYASKILFIKVIAVLMNQKNFKN